MSRRSSAARIGAQTTTGGVVVVADSSAIGSSSALPDRRLDHRPHPPRSTGHTPAVTGGATRRSVLAASLAVLPVSAPLLAPAACGSSAAAKPAARPPSGVAILTAAIAAKKDMIALYKAVAAAHPSLATRLDPLLRDNEAHLAELQRRLIHPVPAHATASPSARPSPPIPSGRVAALAALHSAEAAAAAVHAWQLRTAVPSLAQLLASISACEATHAAALSSGDASPVQAEMRAGAARLSPAAISALQAALADEHAAVYGYGVAGAHLAGRQQDAATRAWNAHRARRDELIGMLAAQGVPPVVAAAAYRLPFGVHSAHTAASLALAIEERVTRAYLGLVAVPDTRLRAFATLAMQESAVRAASLRGSTVAFPGLPHRALASAAPARSRPGSPR